MTVYYSKKTPDGFIVPGILSRNQDIKGINNVRFVVCLLCLWHFLAPVISADSLTPQSMQTSSSVADIV